MYKIATFSLVVGMVMYTASICHAAPLKQMSKKDMFISRGWGAGGMPFSVLYMNPTFSSPKAQAQVVEQTYQPQKTPANNYPRVRNSMRQKNIRHTVIPQLFVSYGWGPLGK